MASRGGAVLHVRTGLPAVLTSPAVHRYAVALYGPDDHPVALPEQAERGAPPGLDSGRIELDGVDWFDDAALIQDAPDAAWQVSLGPDTEQPGVWLAHTPQTGLVEAAHLDETVLVPLAWTGPGEPPPGAADQLERLRTAHALLQPPGPASGAPGPQPAAGHHQLRRIIDGQRYDTASAALVADVSPPGRSRSDFGHEDTGLDRTAGGAWFLAGSGGPSSRWAAGAGRNAWTGGEGIDPLRPGQALALLEALNTDAATALIERHFPARITDAGAAPGPLRPAPPARPAASAQPHPGGPGHRVRGPQR